RGGDAFEIGAQRIPSVLDHLIVGVGPVAERKVEYPVAQLDEHDEHALAHARLYEAGSHERRSRAPRERAVALMYLGDDGRRDAPSEPESHVARVLFVVG